MNGASSPPLLYAECASPLETGLFPVHARWCPRGSRKGALSVEDRTRYTADGPGSDPAPDTNSRTGISFFQGGTNEINLIAMHNITNYELNGQKTRKN